MSFYTHSEHTVKKYTVGQALESAKRRLKNAPVCINAIHGRDLNEKITLEELNNLQDCMYHDSVHWNFQP